MPTIGERIQQLKVEVTNFTDELVAKLKRKAPTATLADDSTLLNNQTQTQMQTPVDALINPHAARTNNAHSLTPAILEAYTDAELADMTDPLLRVGVLPVSQFGSLSGAALAVSYSGFNIVFGGTIPVLLWGKSYSMPAQTVDITETIASPANKTVHVYVTVSNNVAAYQVSETYLSEHANRFYIGKVVCGASAITSGDIAKVTKLDNFRLSTTAAGGSIPMTTGRPTTSGSIDASWKP